MTVTDFKSARMATLVLAAALLLPGPMTFAQDAEPADADAVPAAPATAAPKSVAPKPRRAAAAPARPAARPAQTSSDVLDVVQVLGIRQIDPATYEIDLRLQNGTEAHLRMNAFVMQSLGMDLGTYGKR
jgi:hypothetical protein